MIDLVRPGVAEERGTGTVLLITGNELLAIRITRALGRAGHEVRHAQNEPAASMMLLGGSFGAVALDVALPVQGRTLLLRRLAASDHVSSIPLLLIGEPDALSATAWARRETPPAQRAAVRALQSVCGAYLV